MTLPKNIIQSVLCVAVAFCCNVSIAQTNTIRGRVADTRNVPIPYATLTLLRADDTTKVVKYISSNDKGEYTMKYVKSGSYKFCARSIGYHTQQTNVTVYGNDNLEVDFVLFTKEYEISEAKVTAQGMEFAGDTIKYKPAVYTDGSEIVLGDMLQKLPGITVNENGKVSAQGKQVETILLDGRDLFMGNTQIAVQNLPANIANKVEVINNYSEYDILHGFQSYEKTALNIGVKKEYWGQISGMLSAAAGVKNKFHTKNNAIQLLPKIATSLTLSANNTGEKVMDVEDYIKMRGGFNELIANSEGIQMQKAEDNPFLTTEQNTFKNNNFLAALNVAAQPNKKLKINAYSIFNKTKTYARNETTYYYTDDKTQKGYAETSDMAKRNRFINAYVNVFYNPNETFNLSYKGYVATMSTKRNYDIDKIGIISDVLSNSLPFNTNHNIVAIKKIKKNVLSADATFAYSNTPASYNLVTDSLLLPIEVADTNNTFYVLQKDRLKKTSATFDISYLWQLNPTHFLRLSVGALYTQQSFASNIYKNAPEQIQQMLNNEKYINDIYLRNFDQTASIRLTKNKGTFRYKLGVAARNVVINHNFQQPIDDNNRIFIEPMGEVTLAFSQMHRLKVMYKKSMEMMDADIFITHTQIQNFASYADSSRIYKPYEHKHHIELQYFKISPLSGFSISAISFFDHSTHSSATDYDRNGIFNRTTYRNTPKKQMLYAGLSLSQKFKSPIKISINGNYNFGKMYYFQKSEIVKYTRNSIKAATILETTFKKNFNGELRFTTNIDLYKTYETQRQHTEQYAAKIKFLANRIYFDTEIEYENNNLKEYSQHFYNINATLRYYLSKNKKIAFELNAKDILHLNDRRWYNIAYYNNAFVEMIMRRLPGYILFKFALRL